LAVCLVCGRYEDVGLKGALSKGWVFIRCPECQRGTPFDILAGHLIKHSREEFVEGFCPQHWFKDSGICGYCRMRRTGHSMDTELNFEPEAQSGLGG